MKKWHLYIFLTLFSFWSYSAYSQIPCTVPLPPILTSVSVQPETGITKLNWTLSSSSDIAAYIVYSYSNDNGNRGDSITTLWDPAATSYNYTSTAYKYFSASFVVASYRLPGIPGKDGCPSPFSNVLSTIFAEAYIDTCNKKIVVSWNSYSSVPKKVTGYSILMSVDGDKYTEAANVNSEEKSDTLNDITTDAKYCFVVRANLEGGVFSTSNKACPSPGVCTEPPVIEPPVTEPPVTVPTDTIIIPNVFTPNNDGVNDLFKPVLSFIPKDYHLIISNRRSNILFETRDYDEEWDGSQNGKPQPQGVYLWFLKVTTPSGKSISKTGTVTIINNPE